MGFEPGLIAASGVELSGAELASLCATRTRFHMKRTTLVLDEHNFRAAKRHVAEHGRTLSDVANEFLRVGLARRRASARSGRPVAFPTYRMGRPTVNLADRDALERTIESTLGIGYE